MSKKLEIQGLKLYPHQKDIMDDIIKYGPQSQHVFCVKSSRQKGKSTLIVQCLLYHAINYSRSVSICVSLTMSNVRKLYTELVNGMIQTGTISKHNDSLLTVEFINGSIIYFKSVQQKESLRGFYVRGGILCLDECAYYPEDVFPIIWPWCDASRANTLMVSTPRVKNGTFFNYFYLGLDDTNNKITSYDWNSTKYDFSSLISEEQIELYRRTLPVNQFQSEVMGNFTDDNGSVFQMSYVKWSKYPPEPSTYRKIYCGIDWGSGNGNDYTALTAFNERHEQVLLKYNNTLTPQECIQWIVKNINEHLDIQKIDTILVESNSIGSIYYDLLKSALPKLKIKTFTTTNQSKREIVEDFCAAIGNGDITLLEDDEQFTQLSQYEMEITKSGQITYNGYLSHDDICVSDCLSYHASKKSTTNYTISFTPKPNNRNRLRQNYE